MSSTARRRHEEGDCWPPTCSHCIEELAQEQDSTEPECEVCEGEGVIEGGDSQVQEVGLVAVGMVPCPNPDCPFAEDEP